MGRNRWPSYWLLALAIVSQAEPAISEPTIFPRPAELGGPANWLTEPAGPSSSHASERLAVRQGGEWVSSYGRKAADIQICWARSAVYSRTIDGARIPASLGSGRQLMKRVRSAVEHTWGRFTNIYFYHVFMNDWLPCTDENEPGVVVFGFGERNFADRGQHDNYSTRVILDRKLSSAEEVERAAVVLFGQALMLLPPARDTQSLPNLQEILFAQAKYGLKYSGNLVTWSGACVWGRGYLNTTPCFDEEPNHRWFPEYEADGLGMGLTSGALETAATVGDCIQLFAKYSGALLTTGTCASRAEIDFSNQQWKSPGELCVAASTAAEGAALVLAPCDAAANSRWDFGFMTPGRLELSQASECLAVAPQAWEAGARLTLVGCGTSNPVPRYVAGGQLEFGDGWCVSVGTELPAVGRELSLAKCSESTAWSRFHSSGRLMSTGRCAQMNWAPVLGTYPRAISVDCRDELSQTTAVLTDPLVWDYYW